MAQKKISSLNNVDASFRNVRSKVLEALNRIKDDIVARKIETSNVKIATDNSIPVETILFEDGMFKLVLK